ncbi:50S ribosomal protein L4 [Candidatus Woesearchaeota archaeon]|nr:50S ribosomal protein L4 [Candidatus Woesearchaeota archaeon]
MKATIVDGQGKEAGQVDLPVQFNEEYRPDLISRAVLCIESNNRQPYGADPMAGKRAAAKLSKRRRDYKSCYGHGISRVPRKIMSARGERMNWVGAFAPGMVKGRKAHPPKAEKDWTKKINKQERRKALRSALHAVADKELVAARGHKVPRIYPLILDTSLEKIAKTRDVESTFEKLGLGEELQRVAERHVRAGRGKMRGRKYKRKTGPLIVVGEGTCPLRKAAQNIEGIDVVVVNQLNAKCLAPGAMPGRMTLFTKNALDRLVKERLFM